MPCHAYLCMYDYHSDDTCLYNCISLINSFTLVAVYSLVFILFLSLSVSLAHTHRYNAEHTHTQVMHVLPGANKLRYLRYLDRNPHMYLPVSSRYLGIVCNNTENQTLLSVPRYLP